MSAERLVVGLDGAGLDIVRTFGPSDLPNLHRAMSRGEHAALESVIPPATLPNWTTFLTGVNPGEHGVYDFTTRSGYRVRFTGGTTRATETRFADLDRSGHAVACVGFPATWPPERLEHGIFVSGWDSPVAFEANRSFVHPPVLYDRLASEVGAMRFDDVDELGAATPGWHEQLPARLVARVDRKAALGELLLRDRAWHTFAIYFGESDTAAHHLWAFHDPKSPRAPSRAAASATSGLRRVYRSLDAAIGRLLRAAAAEERDVALTIVSDHGSGGASDKVFLLNRALAGAGLLAFARHRPSGGRSAPQRVASLLGGRARERIFHAFGGLAPSVVESHARFGAIDFGATRAFSEELNYAPSVSLNLQGREPRGTVREADREAVLRETEAALIAVRDPWTNVRIVHAVHRREDLFHGPRLHDAPDLLLELRLDAGYSYNVMPSRGPGPIVERLPRSEHLGAKGRSLAGSHRSHGLYIAAGPQVEARGEVRMTIERASHIAFGPPRIVAREREQTPRASDARVVRRLRALGYVE